mmetsp:Transcript_48403/g.122819  ORF Transcript_48403/g.122819 Transcript_48403/m.122819 type:complete len:213 (-) Transcript_48403:70-708(-)
MAWAALFAPVGLGWCFRRCGRPTAGTGEGILPEELVGQHPLGDPSGDLATLAPSHGSRALPWRQRWRHLPGGRGHEQVRSCGWPRRCGSRSGRQHQPRKWPRRWRPRERSRQRGHRGARQPKFRATSSRRLQRQWQRRGRGEALAGGWLAGGATTSGWQDVVRTGCGRLPEALPCAGGPSAAAALLCFEQCRDTGRASNLGWAAKCVFFSSV